MATCDPQTLLNSANCFDCLSDLQLEQVQVQMLCDLVNVGLAGGPFVRISGDTMTGPLLINSATNALVVNTTELVTDSTNSRVGINTAAPKSSLDIKGNLTVGNTYGGTYGALLGGAFIEGTVGIGTVLPLDKLHVTDGSVRIRVESTTNNANAAFLFSAKGNAGSARQGGLYWKGEEVSTSSFFAVSSDNTNYQFSVLNTGNVGINTIVPKSKLDIVGNLTVGATYGGVNAAPTSGAIIEGLVGIGTTSPSSYDGTANQLVVSGTGDRGITVSSGVTKKSSILFADGTVGDEPYRGGFIYDHNVDKEYIWSNALVSTPEITISNGKVGMGTTSPNANAILDLVSTTLGFKLPNMTTAQKNAIANTAGLMVFDTDLGKACVNSGAGWQTITSV